jgi:hypothetical protein
VIDVAAAVAKAQGHAVAPREKAGAWLSFHRVSSRSFRSVRIARRRPHGLRPLRLAIHLRTSAPLVTPDYRTITLQMRRGGSWHRLARATTRTGGGIRWTVGLRPGRYVLRAVYPGRWDLGRAIRLKPVTVR